MSDPPNQDVPRFIAIDIHKHYLMIGAIDAHKRVCSTLAGSNCRAGRSGPRPICFPPMQS